MAVYIILLAGRGGGMKHSKSPIQKKSIPVDGGEEKSGSI